MFIMKVLAALAFVGSVLWFIALPDYEPAIAIVTTLTAFIASWFGEKRARKSADQNQAIGKNGIGIQAGGNANVGSIDTSREKSAE